jgi:CubicO group peptidase (beta-lactamase class C family)
MIQATALAGAAALLPGATAAALGRSRWRAVDDVLRGFVRERQAAGVCFAASYGREWSPTYLAAGTVAFDSRVAFDENSVCRIYSMTKHVTRIASLLLVEDGRLSLDQPVASVLPEFRDLRVQIDPEGSLDSRPATRTMTMRHLITNTSGLANWTPGSDSGEPLHRLYRERGITPGNFGAGLRRPGYGPQATSLDELVARVAELPLAYEPGTTLHYSIGFDVMALVIQRVAGQAYDAFLRTRLFEPLDMASTGFFVKSRDVRRMTTNYDATAGNQNSVREAEPGLPTGWRTQDDRAAREWLEPPRLIAGGAGLVSTARDFLRYARMLRNDGVLDGARVMKAETAQLALGNLHPPGVAEPTGTAGAGTRSLLRSPTIPPGTIGAAGSAGTLFWIDPARQGVAVFMTQVMYGSPAASPFQPRLFPAMEQDLAREAASRIQSVAPTRSTPAG